MKKYVKPATIILVSLIVLYILFPKKYNPATYIKQSGDSSYKVSDDTCIGLVTRSVTWFEVKSTAPQHTANTDNKACFGILITLWSEHEAGIPNMQ